MADVVDLRTRSPVTHADQFNSELISDLARFSEQLVTEAEIRRRYKFDEATWAALGENENLFAAIEDEKTRRIRNGQLKRERSQKLVATHGPEVLGSILCDPNANPRHRIDSAKVLDDFCTNPAEAGPSGAEKFSIVINLGDQVLHFEKNIALDINPNGGDDDDVTQTPWGLIATTKKQSDDGNGNAL